jgi:ATP-dependent helicase/nuclease subunit A
MSKRRAPVDRPARERILLDLDTTFLVEAGAGSGKTQSLVDRMIALLASGKATIQSLAAVTFTRKAAAELRGRFQVGLERALAAERDPNRRRRLDDALRRLEQGFVGTIHSFCARLLRERPVEAGVDPEFEEMEEVEDGVFRETCWQDFLAETRLRHEEILRDLDEVGLLPDDLKDAFEAVSLYPEVAPAPGRLEPPDYASARTSLNVFLDRALYLLVMNRLDEKAVVFALAGTGLSRTDFAEKLGAVFLRRDDTARGRIGRGFDPEVIRELVHRILETRPENGYDPVQSLMVRLSRRRKNLGFNDHRVLMESLELFEKKAAVTKSRWASKEEAEDFQLAFEDFRDAVAAPVLLAWREFRHAKILSFLGPAVEFHRARRAGASKLNFQDQLLIASRLLQENPEVRAYFRKRFARILVDEFQDTDPVQAEVLFFLAGGPEDERDWMNIRPEPGALFLVGDPKQSIYRFRRADIDIYNFVKGRIRESGGEVLELTANFRSLPCIADWVNPAFEGVFPAEANAHQARFAPLKTVREGCADALSGVLRATVPVVKGKKEKTIAALDAARIADFVAWSCSGRLRVATKKGTSRPAAPGDFLMLFRYKKNMELYARELERRGLPYEISGSEAFADSPEIGEIIRLLQALKDPADPVAAVAVLRGVFFGLSDQVLLEHRAAGGGFVFGGDRPPEESGEAGVRVALRTLRAWWELSKKAPPSAVLETVLERSGLLPYLVSSERGSSRAGDVLKLVEIIRDLETRGMTSLGAVADFTGEWVDAQKVEEMSLTPGRANAVRLMNLHKAKGLEAAVVILANPVGTREHEPDKHVVRVAGGPGPVSAPGPVGYFRFGKRGEWQSRPLSQPPGWAEKAEEEKRYAAAEEERLMYVAATRARDLLVVSTYEGDLGARKAWGILDGRLSGVSELQGPPPQDGFVRERDKLVLKPGDVRKGALEVMKKRGEASRAGYLLESVTSLAKRDREAAEWPADGFGMSWGSAVHALLSGLGKAWLKPPRPGAEEMSAATLEAMARNSLVAVGRDPGESGRLVSLIREIVASEFWSRAMAAEKTLFEVPFSIRVEAAQTDYEGLTKRAGFISVAGKKPVATVPNAPFFLTGAIDLAFFEGDGWVIADYKTDRIDEAVLARGAEESKKAFEDLVDYYRPQVELYARFWEKITGQRVKESGLYFTAFPKWVKVG